MGKLTENGYPSYPMVPADTEFPDAAAPEKLSAEYTGDNEDWKGGPEGLQPGFDLPGISPMSPGWNAAFGYIRKN